MERIALILEISGFFLAGVFIALLNIEAIKCWADKLKSHILYLNQLLQEGSLKILPNGRYLSILRDAGEDIKSIIFVPFKVIMDVFRIVKLLTYFCFRLLIDVRSIRKVWRQRQKIWNFLAENFKNLSRIIRFRFKLFKSHFLKIHYELNIIFLLTFQISMEFAARKLSGKETITKSLIIGGTLMLFVGLVLELISTL